MPGTERQVVTFDDWSKGEYGTQGGQHAPKGSFTGANVVLLQDGSLAPRSGLVDIGLTGVPTGDVLGFGTNPGQFKCWFVVDDTAYDFSTTAGGIGSAVNTYTGNFNSAPTFRMRGGVNGNKYSYVTSVGDATYVLDTDAETVTELTGSPDGRVCARFGQFLFVAGSNANANRVKFSAPVDFNSWPAANYFDVDHLGYSVVALANLNNRMLVGQSDGTWQVYAGFPGYNDVLRRLTQTPMTYPAEFLDPAPTRWSQSADGRVWLLEYFYTYPMSLAGPNVTTFPHLTLTNGDAVGESTFPPDAGVCGLTEGSDVVFVTGQNEGVNANKGLLNCRGTWSKHTFDVDISGWVEGQLDPGHRLFITDGGDTGVAAKFYLWSYDLLVRPPFAGQDFENLGDNSSTVPVDANFTTTEWWAKNGSEVQVQAVIVDFTKWDHGFSVDSNFAVTLTPLYRDGGNAATEGGDGTAVTVGTFTEDPSEASTSGTADRRRWTVSSQFANGFKIAVSDLVGCAIRKIHVVFDSRPTQGV